MVLFRQLFDAESSTYTYLIADIKSSQALLIDPVESQVERDLRLLSELGLELRYSLETHVHADHVTGGGRLRERTGCKTGLSIHAGVECADLHLSEGDEVLLGDLSLRVMETPGHTDTCISYYLDGMVFTGDALLIRGCGRTDFQMGNPDQLFDSITQKLFALPDETRLYPGHDYRGYTVSTIAEEKVHNARLQLNRSQFIAHMNALKLDNPKKMDVAVPANLVCGEL